MPDKNLHKTLLQNIAAAAQKIFNQTPEGLEIVFPPNPDLGHFAVAGFPLAKQFRQSPADIAKKLAEAMVPDDVLQRAVAAGPYLNLTISTSVLFGDLCKEIIAADGSYGEAATGRNR